MKETKPKKTDNLLQRTTARQKMSASQKERFTKQLESHSRDNE